MLAKLEMFIALAREQHFGRAAESLGITQPTLSTGIKQLEDQLGVQLVRRGSRFGGLTPEGQRALNWARQIVGDARRLREEMRFSREGLAGQLRLAVIPTALTWASRLAAGFSKRHPNVSFTVLSRNSIDILTMLDNLEIDAGLSYLDNEPLGRVSTVELYRESYTLVCTPDHPLADRTAIGWRDLAGSRLCLLTPDMQNRRIINTAFRAAGCDPAAQMESNSTVVLVSHVATGDWVTVLPGDLATFLAAGKGLKIVPIRAETPGHAVGLVAPWQEPHTPVLQALLDEAGELAVR
ncbi:LysR family transcriptional regulator [Sinisalibacter aestuarii]|uniref:LysR family transcriptional regulator n=1 Tax=Sinisalibacter aestuarii TaxID=2949426 RepID=A0ABQ5LVT1_9RHOB|nr:LysR family transcriptional regulator [Sinisalibacter aestuarii]GKY89099.1 LysR family transcriptional regulator [Sinisalibacter aestuarii]